MMTKKATIISWALGSLFMFGQAITASAQTTGACLGFRTQTQGGWGAKPSGGNNGTYLVNNFAVAFPAGLEIGCAGNKNKFTSQAAIQAFLPSGSTARALPTGIAINPTSSGDYKNVFAGQLVALTINVGMDNAIPSFSPSTYLLKDLVIAIGPFATWTVGNFLAEANKKIGGCPAANFSFSQYNETASAINEAYDNGIANTFFLKCPDTDPQPPLCNDNGCTAFEVIAFHQGLRYDLTTVDIPRSDPSKMLGTPENNDLLGTFFSLGFGGWTILRVNGAILDKPGDDLRIVETTWWTWTCGQYTERARIEISQDMVSWTDKGIICQDADIDISPLPCISFVRITDVSDPADFVGAVALADGFDVDGIICLQPPAVNGRVAVGENPALTPDHLKSNFASAGRKGIKMYPNPVQNKVNLNLEGITEGQTILVRVIDHSGREVKNVKFNASSSSHKMEINTDDLKSGLYLVVVKGDGVSYTEKIVKK